MTTVGRPRKPTAVLKLTGAYRKHRHADRPDEEIALASGEPVKPRGMTAEGKWWWKQTVESMPAGVYGKCDSALLHQAADWWCMYKQAKQQGDDVAMARATDRYVALSTKLALGPVERTRLQFADGQKPSEILGRERA